MPDRERGKRVRAGYLVRYEVPDDQPASRALLAALDAAGADLQAVDPLAETIDPGALDALVAADRERDTGFDHVSVSVWGFEATVSSDEIVIHDAD